MINPTVTFLASLILTLSVPGVAATTSSSAPLPEVSEAAWSAGFVTLTLGSRFFWGASAVRNFSSSWAGGLRAGSATFDLTQNQSILSAFGRWKRRSFFIESGLTTFSGFSSGSQLLGLAAGTHLSLTRHWKGEIAFGYEGLDRVLLRSPFSSWSTARIQIGFTRDLDL